MAFQVDQDPSQVILARMGGDYFVFLAKLVRRVIDGDLNDASLILATLQANTSPITRTSTGRFTYGAVDAPIPDPDRIPVTTYALAKRLGVPYETARRRMTRLEEVGEVATQREGFIVPALNLSTPRFNAAMHRNWEGLMSLVVTADDVGLWPAGPPDPPPPLDYRRQGVRIASEFFLNVNVASTQELDLSATAMMVLRVVAQASSSGLMDDRTLSPVERWSRILPDAERRPVSVYETAKKLGLPYETTRRTVRRLEKVNLVSRCDRDRIFVPADAARLAAVQRVNATVALATRKLLSELADLCTPEAAREAGGTDLWVWLFGHGERQLGA